MIMVATLKNENQNSSSPNTLTLIRLTAQMISTTLSTQIQCGTVGNQTPMVDTEGGDVGDGDDQDFEAVGPAGDIARQSAEVFLA